MRSEYKGQEVAARAVWPLVESMQAAGIDTSRLPSVDQLAEPALRFSWDQFLSILSMAGAHFNQDQLRAIGAAGLTSPQYASRIAVAKRLLTLEDAYRLMVYPHKVLDYACIQAAVDAKPGLVKITAILLADYAPDPSFFQIMLGAMEALPKLFGVTDAQATGSVDGRYLHFEARYTPSPTATNPWRQRLSTWIRTAYCVLNKNQVDEQLIIRTFAMETALKERDAALRELALDRLKTKRRMGNMTEVVAEYDHLNQLAYLSPNCEKVFGYPSNVLRGNPFQILLPKDRAAADLFFADPRSVPSGVYPMQGLHANGTILELEVAIDHQQMHGGLSQWTATFRDKSARPLSQYQNSAVRPAARLDTAETEVVTMPDEAGQSDAGTPTLLLADDDPTTRRITAKILHRAGFRVVSVEDGASVLAEMSQTQVACLVLDINMPGLTGLEVYEKIQHRDQVMPVVFVSGDTHQLTSKYPQLPVVNKPFRSEHLIEVIREALAA